MKLTKYAHACLVLEEQGKKLVIDPGEYTPDFGALDNIAAVVVTHMHGDHFNKEHLDAILKANPDAQIFTTQEVADELRGKSVMVPEIYTDYTAGPFGLRFAGEVHAQIHQGVPRPQNIGVLVNGSFYYPGDSFVAPDHDVQTLAVPASAPWLKIGEAMDFIQACQPKKVFPTHNALLSELGLVSANKWLAQACQHDNAEFISLSPGESIEL